MRNICGSFEKKIRSCFQKISYKATYPYRTYLTHLFLSSMALLKKCPMEKKKQNFTKTSLMNLEEKVRFIKGIRLTNLMFFVGYF